MKATWLSTGWAILSFSTRIVNSLPAPRVLQPRFFSHLGSQRVQTTYGPFSVPPTTEKNGVETFSIEVDPPCKDCLLTRIQADLKHPDGTTATSDTGLWLRHVLVTNLERDSVTCPLLAAPIYTSGNERAAADLSLSGTLKAGYPLSPTAILIFSLTLMNTSPPNAQNAILTMDWEFMPADTAAASGFRNATPVWLDIDGGCPRHEGSEVPVPPGGGVQAPFSLAMNPPWTADFAGEAVLALMHLQDGGVALEVRRDERVVCRSVAGYGDGVVDCSDADDDDGVVGVGVGEADGRLSSMSTCERLGRVAPGDRWSVTASYDFAKHKPVMEGAAPAPIMGTALLYVLKDGE